jgi:hypothetical protein
MVARANDVSKLSVNAIHSVERIGKHLWFYNYAHMLKSKELIRAKLPFCILPLQGIQRVDVSKIWNKYNTDFHYLIKNGENTTQRVEWYFSQEYFFGENRVYNQWLSETEIQIQKVLEIVGNSGKLK